MKRTIRLTLNGKPAIVSVDGERRLLWVLRTELGLTGTKYGCGEGYCGACTVLVGDEPVRSCQVPIKEVEGKRVTTIEGLALQGKLNPLQEAFAKHDALQCGYCTPGMLVTAHALLLKNPKPSEGEILDALEGNLCRCGAHRRIVMAVADAAAAPKGAGHAQG
jgi:aerobic-type carbon monoxide dehydrogenase small subunit (CoxS/CutS family)